MSKTIAYFQATLSRGLKNRRDFTRWATDCLVVTLLAMTVSLAAHAHKPSDSYLALDVQGEAIEAQWDIALRDLDYAIGLDLNNDGAITWGELRKRHREIESYVLARLAIRADGDACSFGPIQHLVDGHSDGAYAVLKFSARCDHQVNTLALDYGLFFDLDPQHRGLLRLSSGGETTSAIFSPEKAGQQFVLSELSAWRQFTAYCWQGIWHIWIGFDHILFLISLLLPSVLIWHAARWRANPSFGGAFWEVFKIVTAFTLAHSITLSIAALEVVSLPSRMVESAIAASVLAAALNNVYPVVVRRKWLVALVFGLIHGFGFASVLLDLGLPKESLLIALVAFNVGVEIGQLAIVGVFLPLAFLVRDSWFYRRIILIGGSLLIAALALVWLVERLFDLEIAPV